MTLANHRATAARDVSAVREPLVAAAHRGWVDAQNSPNRWPGAYYDRLTVAEQVAYETGRLVLRNVVAAGLPVPMWGGPGDRTGRAMFELVSAEAARIAGASVPGWHV